jgi:subtilisin family serine protease
MTCLRFSILAVLACTLFSSCTTQADWDGTISLVDGVTVVANGGTPILAVPDLALGEPSILGGETLFDGAPLHRPLDAAISGGTLFVADAGNTRILAITLPDGPAVSIGSRGMGPQEFGGVGSLRVVAGSLWVLDTRRRRIVELDPLTHSFGRAVPIEKVGSFVFSGAEELTVAPFNHSSDESTRLVQRYDMDGRLLTTFGEGTEYSPAVAGAGGGTTIAAQGDELLVAHPYPYQIDVYDPSGLLKRRILLKDDSMEPPTEPTQRDGFVLGGTIPRSIRSLHQLDDDRFLVEVADAERQDSTRLDVFSSEGRFQYSLRLGPGEMVAEIADRVLWTVMSGGFMAKTPSYVLRRSLERID